MDEATRDRLYVIGKTEQFEKWMAEREGVIEHILELPPEQWTPDHVRVAIAVMRTQGVIITTYRLKESERQERHA